MPGHCAMFLLLFAVWGLFPSNSNAKVIPESQKCILEPGQVQRTFITAFMRNNYMNSETFQLYLVTCDKAATATVTVPQPFFNKTIHIDKDSSTLVTLDHTYMITENDITSKVVLVTSDVAISVFAFNTHKFTADAMICLPEEDLGMEYYIVTPRGSIHGKQFAVANGYEHEVQVHVTVSGSITYKGISYKTGDSFTLSLGNQQVIQFQSPDDLTGTKILSSAPVAVFSGHSCFAGIGNACDTLTVQLDPVENWGEVFAVFPFFNHTKDVIIVNAGSPDTFVTIDSPKGTTQHSLQEGAHVEITVDKILLIDATKPVMVSYLFQETPSTGITYDPFIATIPLSLLGRRYYKFVTQSHYDNFILIVSRASSDSKFYLDGKPLSSYPTTMKEFKGFRGWQVTLNKTEGQHEIYHETSTFTLYVFGTAYAVSYGYSLGQRPLYSEPTQEPEFVPEPTQEPECSIRCLPDIAEYILPYSLVSDAHLDVLNIHLKDPLCRAVKKKDHYLIRIPYNRCGSNVLYEDGRTFYANTIYGTIPDTEVHRIEIPVRCEMESNRSLELVVNPKVTDEICKGDYNISIKLYQSDSFTEPVTLYPYEVDLHSNLHVELEVVSEDEGLQIFIETLVASPSLDDSKKKYKIIEHGCQEDSTLQVHPVTDRRLQRISFHALKFDHFHEFYLSCNVIICHNSTSPNRCSQGCITSRLRRDLHTSKQEVDISRLSQGPVVFASERQNYNLVVPALSIVLGMAVLLAGLGLVIQKRNYQRKMAAHLRSNAGSS